MKRNRYEENDGKEIEREYSFIQSERGERKYE